MTAKAQAEEQLARMIADAAQRRQRGEAVPAAADEAARLVIEIGARGDDAFDVFFEALARELGARGTRLPPIEELPPSLAPLIAIFEGAFVVDRHGELDAERTAARLDEALGRTLGTSPRQIWAAELREEIRREAADSVAESLRQHGLVPACDLPPEERAAPPEEDQPPREDPA